MADSPQRFGSPTGDIDLHEKIESAIRNDMEEKRVLLIFISPK